MTGDERHHDSVSEDEFLARYDMGAYTPVAVTVDVVVLSILDGRLSVLVVERGEHPFKGSLALPGGFVRDGESLDAAAARELAEETGVVTGPTGVFLEQLATFGDPERDPRGRVVSVAYVAFVPDAGLDPRGGGDATTARWLDLADSAAASTLAFDHAAIVAAAVERVRAKLEYTTVAATFVAEPFTLAELRRVYEATWGVAVHPSNFARKVTSTVGFVVATGEQRQPQGAGRPAQLYRRGPAMWLDPPLRRPETGDDPAGSDDV